MKAVIMAGGEGTRLRPLSLGAPKPMTPLLGRPVMEHIINLLKTHGMTDICVTLCYRPQSVMEYFRDGAGLGVRLSYFIEEEPLGTAGSVKNCMEHTPAGGTVTVTVREDALATTLVVSDTGPGIAAEDLPHIFERFYRTDQSRDRKTGGTGLGLSIAKWIVERHGGWFEVVSRPEVGTRITVVLPALQKTVDNPSAAAV